MSTTSTVFLAVGRRKTSSARVRLIPGEGNVTINGRTLEQYFPTETSQREALKPLTTAEVQGQFDVVVRVHGGGVTGQSAAVAPGRGPGRAKYNPARPPPVKKARPKKRAPPPK
ncbi:MAG: 30S ribosomal protein S9 [Opitutales bacterium]